MSKSKINKIAYLFGAGATHAELTNLGKEFIDENYGLLTKDVSSRVIEKATRDRHYLKDIAMVSSTKGSVNIELLISLIESSKIDQWEKKTGYLKQLVRNDIERILTKARTKRFYLHKALLELHRHKTTNEKENLIGLITLNYDAVLDDAYEEHYQAPNYCFSLERNTPRSENIPLLKLHGSFNWRGKKIRGRTRTIEIIPLGSSKHYLHAPYSFIWNQAMETIIECDVLRVIGSSLSSNDTHLIDLLFEAHLERGAAFDIEIISSDDTGKRIQESYRFFPKIRTLTEIEPPLIPETSPTNAFKTWLKYKSRSVLGASLTQTKYLKRLNHEG